jgi:hypothetical protein
MCQYGYGKEHMPVSKLNRNIIEAAIVGFEHQKTEMDRQISELRAMLTGPTETATTPEATPGKRKKFSAAARRKMALAQKARWAKIKGESGKAASAPAKAPKAKRKLSAAGRAAIVAATKKRWAAVKAAQAKATKKTAPARKKGAVKEATVKTAATKKSAPAVAEVPGQ